MWRVILCGSVVEQNFDWGEVVGQIGDPNVTDKSQFILNDCGNKDSLPVFAESAGWRYGNAGTDGFGGSYVQDRFHHGGHGLFFTPDFIDKYWKPFIESGTVVPGNARQGESVPGFFRSIARFPWRWMQPLLLALFLSGLGWVAWFFWLSGPERINVPFDKFVQDFNQVRQDPTALAAFKKAYAGKRIRWRAFVRSVHPGDEPYYRLGQTVDAPRREQAIAGFSEGSFNPALPVGAGITVGGTVDEATNTIGIILRDCEVLGRLD